MNTVENHEYHQLFTLEDAINFLISVAVIDHPNRFLLSSIVTNPTIIGDKSHFIDPYEFHLQRLFYYQEKFPNESKIMLWIYYNVPVLIDAIFNEYINKIEIESPQTS